MENHEYNGYTNYETWLVKLWLDNYQGTQEMVEEMSLDAKGSDNPVVALADTLQAMHEEFMPEVEGVYQDLLNAALGSVNWHEIAKAYLEDFE